MWREGKEIAGAGGEGLTRGPGADGSDTLQGRRKGGGGGGVWRGLSPP